ncbi:hypothetical protein COB52_02875 [Candidatus Kaiserbacteria bacterium]|nr:MAG: hypothetical protein COB52_02875 [Candidatus Kaiserbacteria bacterium]
MLKFLKIRAFARRYWNTTTKVALFAITILILLAVTRIILSSADAVEGETFTRSVALSPASAISAEKGLEVSGIVVAKTQGDLRTKSTGIITKVYREVSETVGAGAIIATMENASELAGVAQSKASVAQAKANLSKVSGGTLAQRLEVLSLSTQNAKDTLREAEIGVQNTLLNAYITTDTSFVGGVDSLFKDADGANPTLTFITTNGIAEIEAEHSRFVLQKTLDRQKEVSSKILYFSGDNLINEINLVESEMLLMKDTLDKLIAALDGSTGVSKVVANTARSSVLSTRSALSSSRGALNAAKNAVIVAEENESIGALSEDTDIAEAQVQSALAGLAQSYARLEDTYVRAPVSGVITRLSIKPGDFVNSFQDVGLVASRGALEVEAFVSVSISKQLTVGDKVTVDGVYAGVITSISESIDPIKRQIEIRVAILEEASIPNGSRTSITFFNKSAETIRVPISALKLIGSDSFVFTVVNGKLVSIPVTLGEIVQNSVTLTSGVAPSTEIVLDARGLNEGDSVNIK